MKHYTKFIALDDEVPFGARLIEPAIRNKDFGSGMQSNVHGHTFEIISGYFWDGQVWQSNALLKLLEEERALPS